MLYFFPKRAFGHDIAKRFVLKRSDRSVSGYVPSRPFLTPVLARPFGRAGGCSTAESGKKKTLKVKKNFQSDSP